VEAFQKWQNPRAIAAKLGRRCAGKDVVISMALRNALQPQEGSLVDAPGFALHFQSVALQSFKAMEGK